jgi:hypothetical protein
MKSNKIKVENNCESIINNKNNHIIDLNQDLIKLEKKLIFYSNSSSCLFLLFVLFLI